MHNQRLSVRRANAAVAAVLAQDGCRQTLLRSSGGARPTCAYRHTTPNGVQEPQNRHVNVRVGRPADEPDHSANGEKGAAGALLLMFEEVAAGGRLVGVARAVNLFQNRCFSRHEPAGDLNWCGWVSEDHLRCNVGATPGVRRVPRR